MIIDCFQLEKDQDVFFVQSMGDCMFVFVLKRAEGRYCRRVLKLLALS